jgi:hypothetical protein
MDLSLGPASAQSITSAARTTGKRFSEAFEIESELKERGVRYHFLGLWIQQIHSNS